MNNSLPPDITNSEIIIADYSSPPNRGRTRTLSKKELRQGVKLCFLFPFLLNITIGMF